MLKEAAAVPRELFLGKLILLGLEPRNIIVSLEHHLPELPIYGLEVLGGDMQELLSLDKSPPLEQDSAAVGHL
jgi:hypothetical protein